MTTVGINSDWIIVRGHSGYAEPGKDIVCAAISTLTEATYNYLIATDNKVASTDPDAEGLFIIRIDKLNKAGKKIIESFIQMVDDIASQYPENLRRLLWKS